MRPITILFLLLIPVTIFSQFGDIQYVDNLFRGTRIINGHSVETLWEGEMEFLISHRFGRLNGGAYEFFGLDQSTIRLGLDYGIKNWLMIGIGRSSLGKHYDAFGKMQFLKQSTGKKIMPVSMTAFSSVAMNTLKPGNPEEALPVHSRLSFVNQLLIARKFDDRLSLQLMPSWVHFNLVESIAESNDIFSLGVSGSYQVSKNIALTLEYYQKVQGQLPAGRFNPIALGIDINTGSHVFQIHLTNANGMIGKAFIGETTGDWTKGDIHLGFNMSRTFKLKGRRY